MGLTINFKKVECHWCGSLEAFKCTCGFYTCSDCKKYPVDDKCVHVKSEPVESDGWVIDDTPV